MERHRKGAGPFELRLRALHEAVADQFDAVICSTMQMSNLGYTQPCQHAYFRYTQ